MCFGQYTCWGILFSLMQGAPWLDNSKASIHTSPSLTAEPDARRNAAGTGGCHKAAAKKLQKLEPLSKWSSQRPSQPAEPFISSAVASCSMYVLAWAALRVNAHFKGVERAWSIRHGANLRSLRGPKITFSCLRDIEHAATWQGRGTLPINLRTHVI